MTDTFTPDDLTLLRADLAASGLARQHVVAELDRRTRPASLRHPQHRREPRRPRAVWALAAAAVAVGCVTVPALVGGQSSGAVALGPSRPLEFPLSVPRPGLGPSTSTFGLDGDLHLAAWQGRDGRIVASVREGAGVGEDDSIPATATRVVIDEHAGFSFAVPGGWTVTWDDSGDAVRVTGSGSVGSESAVVAIAEGVTDEPVAVGLPFTVTPEGWTVTAYNEVAVTLSGEPGLELTLVRVDHPSQELAAYAATDVETVTRAGRTITIGARLTDIDRGPGGGWVAETEVDGQWFAVLAPGVLTREQVLRIAAGVR